MSDGLRNIIYTLRTNVDLTDLASSPFTHVIASFLLPESDGSVSASDELQNFLSDPSLLSDIQGAGKIVLVSLGGQNVPDGGWEALASDTDSAASAIWSFVEENGFDGVDFDFEDTDAFESPNASYNPVTFLADVSIAVKKAAGDSSCIVTHAPQPPYLYPGQYTSWSDGAYQEIFETAGDSIDWLNIQYYNNDWYVGTTLSDQQEHVSGTSGSSFPTSIVSLSSSFDVSKLVLGRLTSAANSTVENSGYLSASDTANGLITPLVEKYGSSFGGAMGWEFSLSSTTTDNADDWGETIGAALDG